MKQQNKTEQKHNHCIPKEKIKYSSDAYLKSNWKPSLYISVTISALVDKCPGKKNAPIALDIHKNKAVQKIKVKIVQKKRSLMKWKYVI